jgi:hypothetical protein
MVLCKLDEVQGTDNPGDHPGQCTDLEASPAIHQESATRIKINFINNVIYPEGRTTCRIEPSHSKAACHEDIGSPITSGVVVGEYRESEITPSLVSLNPESGS